MSRPRGRPYTSESTFSSYAPSLAPSTSKRASLLSVASSLFSKKTPGDAVRPMSPSASTSALPDLIEITPNKDEEETERARLREMAARAIGMLPSDLEIQEAPPPKPDPIPPFPASRAKIPSSAVLISTKSPLQKYYPTTSIRVFKAKGWKPRHIILSHQPNALWFLHTFHDESEVERLEIVHNSFISIAEEQIGGKKSGVIAVAGKDVVRYDTLTVCHFHMPDSKQAQQWIDQVKSAVLALRTLRESIPLTLPGLPGPSLFTSNGHFQPNEPRSSISPGSPVGDMDTVLNMRKQGLLSYGTVSPTRSTFSAFTDEKEGHRNSNSLSSKASVSTQREKDKTAVQALKGLFVNSSSSTATGRPKSSDSNAKQANRPRSPSAATSIRSFLSSSHTEENYESSGKDQGLLSGWVRSTSPPPPVPNVSAKRLPISGTPGNIAQPIAAQLDRRISETHFHHPDEPTWSAQPQAPSAFAGEAPVFTHPFANMNDSSSTLDHGTQANPRLSVFSTSSRQMGLQPPPRRSIRVSTTSQAAPTSFKEDGRRMSVLNSPSLTGLGPAPSDSTASDSKDVRDLTFGHSRGQNRHLPLSTAASAIPVPVPPAADTSFVNPSLTPPSSATRSRRFSRQGSSFGGVPVPKGPPPSGPLPEAPSHSPSPTSTQSPSPIAFKSESKVLADDADENGDPVVFSHRLSPSDAFQHRSISRSPRPTSIAISVSSVEPGDDDAEVDADRSSPVDLAHDDDDDDAIEDEVEERKSILSTLPTFSSPSKRASTGSGSGHSFGYHSSPASVANGSGGRDSLDGNDSSLGADSVSVASGRDSFGNVSMGHNGGHVGSLRSHRTSLPPPQRGPAPAVPLPPAPGSPEHPRNSIEDTRSNYSPISGSKRLSTLSMSSVMSSGNRSSTSSDLLPPTASHVQRFRDRAARLSMAASPKPPPSMALPELPPTAGLPMPSLDEISAPSQPPSERSSSPTGIPRESFGVGRQLSKRLRILSAPSSSGRSSAPTSPTASLPPPPQPYTNDSQVQSDRASTTSSHSSFLQISTPVTPNIPIPKVHSSSAMNELDEQVVETGLRPPPRRSSWGNSRSLHADTNRLHDPSALPPVEPHITALQAPASPGPFTPTTPTAPVSNGKEDSLSSVDDKPRSTRSSVISLRIQV